MSYINRVKEELSGMTYPAMWQYLFEKTYGDFNFLLHPCTVTEEILSRQLPESVDIQEVLKRIPTKQKELAKRLNIPILPSDRQPGFMGQAALFEVLREMDVDFSFYIDDQYETLLKLWLDGFGLFCILSATSYAREYYAYEHIDLVKHFFEPLNPNTIVLTFERNWMHRVLANWVSLHPIVTDNTAALGVLKHVVCSQDGWGPTVSRVVNWTGKTRKEAKRLIDVMSVCGLLNFYRLVLKNVGIVKTVTTSTSPSKTLASLELHCTSLNDGQDYFISFSDYREKLSDRDCLDRYAISCNVENIDPHDHLWQVKDSVPVMTKIEDLQKLFHNSDHTIADNTIPPTARDLLVAAVFLSMQMEYIPGKREHVIRRLVDGCGIPREEANLAVRNVLRKHMICDSYSIIVAPDREAIAIHFDDSPTKTVPALSMIVPSLPMMEILSNQSFSHGYVFAYMPTYLSCDVRDIIESSLSDFDVNAELFVFKSYKRAPSASVLSLIQEE
jgi:hypothetical protein